MKRFRKILTVFLAMVMLAGTATGVGASSTVYLSYFDWSRLCNELPEEHKAFFSDILSLPRDNFGTLEVTKVIKSKESNGLAISLRGCAHIFMTLKNGGGYSVYNRGTAYIYSMVVDRETNTPISVRKIGFMYEDSSTGEGGEINNINIRLPDNFNREDHKLTFFLYYKYSGDCPSFGFEDKDILYPGEYGISEPIEVDLSIEDIYGNGDANGDGKLNLADTLKTLRYISGWGINVDRRRADTNGDESIDLSDVTIMLKRVAGWQDEKITTKYYFDQYALAEDNRYQKNRIEYLEDQDHPLYKPKTADELEIILKKDTEELRNKGFLFEEIEIYLPESNVCQLLCEYNNWSRDDLIEFMREAYYAE